jgi:hypothetical protein
VPSNLDLSIVVIPLVGNSALANCLDRLPLVAVECIVVLRETMGEPRYWQQRYPSVIFLHSPEEPVPLRRQRGTAAAAGDVVGILEDTSWPDPDWCAAVRSTFIDIQIAAAGGPVQIAATLPSRCQALGWIEFGRFVPRRLIAHRRAGSTPDQPIVASRVPGNNMAFRRTNLIAALRGEFNGLFESSVCAKMLAAGHQVVFQPRMLVTYSACDRYNMALSTRLSHGRIYAGMQLQKQTLLKRTIHVAKATLLPIVLSVRTMVEMINSKAVIARLPVLFWVTLMHSAWAMGEAIGAVAGLGKSLNEWR